MQLWFARGTEVTLRDQLVTQIILGIQCNDLSPGQRLPSTRELSRRFRLHPNTVSAGYRQLEREQWVEFRHGSGIYVRQTKPDLPLSPAAALDQMIANLFQASRTLGIPLSILRSRLRNWLELRQPDHFLLIEPDEELRRIIAAEMQAAVTLPVRSCGPEESNLLESLEGAIAAVLPSKAKLVRQLLPAGVELLTLSVQSATSALSPWLPAPSGTLVGIASRWPEFLRLGHTMLLASGFAPESLVIRDARKANWRRGLQQTAAVICESVSVAELPEGCRPVVFRVLAESSLEDLRRYEASHG